MLATLNTAMYTKDMEAKGAGEEKASQEHRAANMMDLIRDMADNTGCQGVPNIKRAKSIVRRVFWLIIVFGGVGMMVWKIQEAVVKYYSYPVETKITYEYSPQLNFPAVTICNHNAIKENSMGYCGEGVQSLMTSEDRVLSTEDSYYQEMALDNERDDYGAEDSDLQARESLTEYMASWSDDIKRKVGHNLSIALTHCSFEGIQCGPDNFTWFHNYLYGNCYTFNAENWNLENGLDVSKVGPLYGLVMELYVEEQEYTALTDSVGYKVLIHNQTEMPFPEDTGFSISPGQKTSIGLRRTEITRPEPLYGDCQKFTDEEMKKINGFVGQLPHIKYTKTACQKTCYLQKLIERCKCFDSRYPYNSSYDAYKGIAEATDNLGFCKTNDSCFINTEEQFALSELGCSEQCPSSCFDVRYKASLSTASYPTTQTEDDVLRRVQKIDRTLYDWVYENQGNDSEILQFLKQNIIKVEVYYEDLNFESIISSGSYGSMELFSDLGGQTGFWLGLSVIALFEVVELVFDIVIIIWRHISVKSKGKVASDN